MNAEIDIEKLVPAWQALHTVTDEYGLAASNSLALKGPRRSESGQMSIERPVTRTRCDAFFIGAVFTGFAPPYRAAVRCLSQNSVVRVPEFRRSMPVPEERGEWFLILNDF